MAWRRWAFCALMLASQHAAFAQTRSGATSTQPGRGQPPALKTSLAALQRLLTTVPASPAQLAFARFRARTALDRLEQLSARWPAESPADYRANLDTSVQALARTLASADTTALTNLLDALGDDLEVKLEHCMRSGGKLGGSVVVSVRTVAGDRESRNWQVFYIPKVFEVAAIAPDRFPRLSSPTSDTLVPGRYVFWGRDANNRLSERVTLKVGEGRKDVSIDLTVPVSQGR